MSQENRVFELVSRELIARSLPARSSWSASLPKMTSAASVAEGVLAAMACVAAWMRAAAARWAARMAAFWRGVQGAAWAAEAATLTAKAMLTGRS
jgi:hypothetical protein